MHRFLIALTTMITVMAANAFRVDTLLVHNKCLDTSNEVTVVVPENNGTQKFPVVYLLHGYSDNNRCYIDRIKGLGEMSDRYKMIFVTPNGRDSWYWDSDSIKMETFIVKGLVPYIDKIYPVLPGRENHAIMGLSMGGHGSFYLALRHPEIWGNIGSMSGGLDLLPFPTNWNLPKILGSTSDKDPEKWKAHSVAYMIPQIKAGNFNIIFDCGSEDFFAEVNDNMHRALLEAGVPHDYISRPGGHNWQYWNNALPYILHYFDTKFPR